MAINFNTNMETLSVSTTRAARAKNFTEFTSKKKLKESGVLNDEQYKLIDGITGTFNIAIHNEMRYVAVTIYRANTEPKYSFVIVDMEQKGFANAASIKEAKRMILEQVAEDAAAKNGASEETATAEQATENTDAAAEEEANSEAQESASEDKADDKSGKRGKGKNK